MNNVQLIEAEIFFLCSRVCNFCFSLLHRCRHRFRRLRVYKNCWSSIKIPAVLYFLYKYIQCDVSSDHKEVKKPSSHSTISLASVEIFHNSRRPSNWYKFDIFCIYFSFFFKKSKKKLTRFSPFLLAICTWVRLWKKEENL